MPFWICYYHVVWATKNRAALITPIIEPYLFEGVRAKSSELDCPLLAINAVDDHIHVAACIRPGISVGDWVGKVKGASSHAINVTFPDLPEKFRWQRGYGVMTFGSKNLPYVKDYILRQKEHHAAGQIEGYLERIDDVDE